MYYCDTPASDAERVLRIIDSLAEHVPDHIKVELDSLRGLLKSPLFYQYLDYQDLQKISELTDSVSDPVIHCILHYLSHYSAFYISVCFSRYTPTTHSIWSSLDFESKDFNFHTFERLISSCSFYCIFWSDVATV